MFGKTKMVTKCRHTAGSSRGMTAPMKNTRVSKSVPALKKRPISPGTAGPVKLV